LINDFFRPGNRLDLTDEHTHGLGSRLDRGDTHKQESAYRTTNEYLRNYGKRKINNAECDTTPGPCVCSSLRSNLLSEPCVCSSLRSNLLPEPCVCSSLRSNLFPGPCVCLGVG
jgi:hypothetical protein